MQLRRYRPEDLPQIVRLFCETIQHINCRDYTGEQVRVWSGRGSALLGKNAFFERLYTLVAVEGEQVAGYGNIDDTGYLDHLYVHKDYQGRGIATALCDALEGHAALQGIRRIEVHASITARPFFLHRGYRVVQEQQVDVEGVWLTNFVMEKLLPARTDG